MVKKLSCPAAVASSSASKSGKAADNYEEVADFVFPGNFPKKQKVAEEAPVQIGMQIYSNNSELCGLPGYKDKVVVLMMEHEAKPGYLYKYLQSFETFLAHMHGEQDDFPENMDEFEKRYEMRCVVGSEHPVEKQRPYARGAYVKHSVAGNFIEVLDSFFSWRQKKNIGGVFPSTEVIITKGHGVTLSESCEYDCKVVVRDVAGRVEVPFSPLSIPSPAWSKRHAYVKVRVLSEHEVQLRFEGDNYSFRSNFNALGVPGRYETASGTPLPDDISLQEKKKAYFVRIIKKWDVSDKEKSDFLLQMIKESIYENTLVVIQWCGDIMEASIVAELKESMCKLDNVYAEE